VLSGVSAGAVCWFDMALSESGGDGLVALPTLGFVSGSCCPHYSTEEHRRASFAEFIEQGLLPTGIAIDDGVAVHLRGGEIVGGVSARKDACAYHLSMVAGRLETKTLTF
jgi:dipeptidase E